MLSPFFAALILQKWLCSQLKWNRKSYQHKKRKKQFFFYCPQWIYQVKLISPDRLRIEFWHRMEVLLVSFIISGKRQLCKRDEIKLTLSIIWSINCVRIEKKCYQWNGCTRFLNQCRATKIKIIDTIYSVMDCTI